MPLKHLVKPVALQLKNKQALGNDVYSFNFSTFKPLMWKAGQYGLLEIKLPSGRTGRKPFSIASAPSEKIVTIATKIKRDSVDPFKLNLLSLKKGQCVNLRGPIGPMHIKNQHKAYAFLASGIGITPFRAILKQLEQEEKDVKITLFYVGNKDSHYFKEDLNSAKAKISNFNIVYIYRPDRITGQIIEDTLGKDLLNTTFFLSGSPKLVRSYKRTILGLGVARGNIKSNPFWGHNLYPNQPKFS